MAVTISSLAKSIASEVGEDSSNLLTSSLFESWVIDSISRVFSESSDWSFAFQQQVLLTSAGIATYSVGTNVTDIDVVIDVANRTKLILTTEEEITLSGGSLSDVGTPVKYLRISWSSSSGPRLQLWPVPVSEKEYLLVYTVDPVSLVPSSDVPLPFPFLACLKLLVKSLYFLNSGEVNLSDRYRTDYNIMVNNLRNKYTSSRDLHARVGVRDVPIGMDNQPFVQYPANFGRSK